MNVWAVIGFVLWSAFKFLVAPPFGFEAGLNFFGVVLWMFIGGVIGITTFYNLSAWIFERARKKRLERRLELQDKGLPNDVKIFTSRNKKIVRLKHKLGMYGVVFLALPIISLPITGLICAKFFKHEGKKLYVSLLISLALWSFLLTGFFELFYHDLREWISNL